MTQPEALRLANYFDYHGFFDSDRQAAAELRRLHEENERLRQALAQPEQEPVAWMNKKSAFMCGKTDESGVAFHIITTSKQTKHHTVPLYTAPPKREWVGLTDEEMKKTWYEMQNIMGWYSFQEISQAVEAKLKEKNI